MSPTEVSVGKIAVEIRHEDCFLAAGLAAALSTNADIEVVSRAEFAGQQAHGHLRDFSVTVILADYLCGMRLLKQMRSVMNPGRDCAKVLIVTQRAREWDVRSAMAAGADGYLLQCCTLEELLAGVRALGCGSRYLCSDVATRIADCMSHEELTGRETDVLELLTHGLPNKAIAKELGISAGTVKAHMKRVFHKLDAKTRTHAVAVAVQRGLLPEKSRPALHP